MIGAFDRRMEFIEGGLMMKGLASWLSIISKFWRLYINRDKNIVTEHFLLNDAYILHHLGLGDHVLCNALVRQLALKYNKIFLFTKIHNFEAIKWMYRDLYNINILPIKNDHQACNYIVDNEVHRLINIGMERNALKGLEFDQEFNNIIKYDYSDLLDRLKFDHAFYAQLGFDFSLRWNGYYCERDLNREKRLFESLGLVPGQYVFVHDDPERGFVIGGDNIVNKSLMIFRPKPHYSHNIFDYSMILEIAAEIHCIDSSFKHLTESLGVSVKHLHHYVGLRGSHNSSMSSSRLNWIIH